MIAGYVALRNKKIWAPFELKDGLLTVFTGDTQPLNTAEKLSSFEIDSTYKCLIGKVNNRDKAVVFIVDRIPFADELGSSMFRFPLYSTGVQVYAYFLTDSIEDGFSGLSVHCTELDYFYSSMNSLDYRLNDKQGLSLSIKDSTDIKKHFHFQIKNVNVDGILHTDRSVQYHSTSPLSFGTKFRFTFPETKNIEFIFSIYYTVTKFIYFITRRTNIYFDSVKLIQTYISSSDKKESKRSIDFFDLYQQKKHCTEKKTLEKTLPYEFVKSHLSELFQFIADDKLYIRHIAETSESSFTIARMILITAGFEWNANTFINPPISLQKTEVKEDVLNYLYESIKSCSNKKKRYFRSFVQIVERHNLSLSGKIVFALKRYETILLPFIKYLYRLNKIELDKNYKNSIGKRIQEHRNAFAHGDISKDIDYNVVLDYVILEWVIYCIVLEQIGYSKKEITQIIHYIRDGNIHLASGIIDHYNKNK